MGPTLAEKNIELEKLSRFSPPSLFEDEETSESTTTQVLQNVTVFRTTQSFTSCLTSMLGIPSDPTTYLYLPYSKSAQII